MKTIKLSLALMALIAGLAGVLFVTSTVVEAHTRTVKITVDKNGFSPSSIEVEAGHKLNLVFNRADKDNCGKTVVFPKYKIRKALPVGKDIIVTITPTKAGNISFTCGMGTMKGKLVVSD
ncbi:MAG: cupredoxin domain-containing protein [Pyrinomonadaceae bacterium]